MLKSLSIRNLALISDLTLEFREGFTVFTGETGAGKSILSGAIGLLLGDRAYSEYIRKGYDYSVISGEFIIEPGPELKKLLEENQIPFEDSSLMIKRKIHTQGKNRININSRDIQLSLLRRITSGIIDIHGQHDNQTLLRPDSAKTIIDSLPGIGDRLEDYTLRYQAMRESENRIASYEKNLSETLQKKDFLEYQLNEISSLELKEDEEKHLNEEYKLLSSVTERLESVNTINRAIEGEEEYPSLEQLLSTVRRELNNLSRYDETAAPWIEDVENFSSFLSDLSAFCSSYIDKWGSDYNTSRLSEINSRIAAIQRLKKKYSTDFPGLLKKEKELRKSLSSIQSADLDKRELEADFNKKHKACIEAGKKLKKLRESESEKFDKDMTSYMKQLGFRGGEWKTSFSMLESPGPTGIEEISFLVRTNAGEDLLPVERIASGGELSRLMLSIKTILSDAETVPVLIFDEIDAGIGGHTAVKIAELLRKLSYNHQVITISHLPQIASSADNHYAVYKSEKDGRTITGADLLSTEERIDELSRMIGDSDSETSKLHARELLERNRS